MDKDEGTITTTTTISTTRTMGATTTTSMPTRNYHKGLEGDNEGPIGDKHLQTSQRNKIHSLKWCEDGRKPIRPKPSSRWKASILHKTIGRIKRPMDT